MSIAPTNLKLNKTVDLRITWADGQESVFPVGWLRAKCPCAGCKELREQQKKSRLTVLNNFVEGPITAVEAAMAGNYALRITFSDGHDTGIYSFGYLRELHEASRNDR
jgi:DUF971 family protein